MFAQHTIVKYCYVIKRAWCQLNSVDVTVT